MCACLCVRVATPSVLHQSKPFGVRERIGRGRSRKVSTHDKCNLLFPSSFFCPCLCREGFGVASHWSTPESNFVYSRNNRSPQLRVPRYDVMRSVTSVHRDSNSRPSHLVQSSCQTVSKCIIPVQSKCRGKNSSAATHTESR